MFKKEILSELFQGPSKLIDSYPVFFETISTEIEENVFDKLGRNDFIQTLKLYFSEPRLKKFSVENYFWLNLLDDLLEIYSLHLDYFETKDADEKFEIGLEIEEFWNSTLIKQVYIEQSEELNSFEKSCKLIPFLEQEINGFFVLQISSSKESFDSIVYNVESLFGDSENSVNLVGREKKMLFNSPLETFPSIVLQNISLGSTFHEYLDEGKWKSAQNKSIKIFSNIYKFINFEEISPVESIEAFFDSFPNLKISLVSLFKQNHFFLVGNSDNLATRRIFKCPFGVYSFAKNVTLEHEEILQQIFRNLLIIDSILHPDDYDSLLDIEIDEHNQDSSFIDVVIDFCSIALTISNLNERKNLSIKSPWLSRNMKNFEEFNNLVIRNKIELSNHTKIGSILNFSKYLYSQNIFQSLK